VSRSVFGDARDASSAGYGRQAHAQRPIITWAGCAAADPGCAVRSLAVNALRRHRRQQGTD
jgi:hypothetical protein